MPLFVRIDMSLLDNWHLVFKSAKEMLNHSRSWIFEGVHKMDPLEPHG